MSLKKIMNRLTQLPLQFHVYCNQRSKVDLLYLFASTVFNRNFFLNANICLIETRCYILLL